MVTVTTAGFSAALNARKLQFVPYQDATVAKDMTLPDHRGAGVSLWVCKPAGTNGIPAEYLPPACRG